jgi:Tfp pilus assembly protein PilZ
MNLEAVVVSGVLIAILFAIVLGIYKIIIRNVKNRMIPANGNQVLKTPSGSVWEEKRQDHRIDIICPVLMETSRGVIKAKTKDLGLEGAFVVCQEPLPLNERFTLIIKMPEQKPLRLACEVVWSNSNVHDEKVVTRGMGVRFIQTSEEDRKSLNAIIALGIQVLKTSSGSGFVEKRQDSRIGVVCPVLMETPRGVIKGKTKDLCLGGTFITCQEPLPLNERFTLIIKMPEQKPLRLACEVTWSNGNVHNDKIIHRGMGVRFTQNTEEDRKSLNAIIALFEEQKELAVGDGHY